MKNVLVRNSTAEFLTFIAEGKEVIAAEWMYHPYHFEMYQS